MAEKILENMSLEAEKAYDKYKDYIDAYEKKAVTSRVNGKVELEEVVALGKKLENFENWLQFTEANGGISDLGVLPKVGLDVIVAASAVDISSLFASEQVIPEERGIIYFKNVVSNSNRNGNTKGQTLLSGQNGRQNIFNAGEGAITETGATGDGTNTSFAFTVSYAPVRPRFVSVYLESDPSIKAIDDGQGNLIGKDVSGTINYETGAVTVTFSSAPANGDDIIVDYVSDFDSTLQDEIPSILTDYVSTDIVAKTYALRTEMGLLKQYALQKRFGLNAEEMMAKDLMNEMVSISATVAVREAYSNAQGTVTFDVVPPSGVSSIEHKLSFVTTVVPQAQANVLDNSGRLVGTGTIIAGTKATAYIMGLPGFKGVDFAFNATGTLLVGTLNGMPVIRSSVLPATEALYVTKGNMFEAGLVKGTYMPLFTTDTFGGVNLNPLRQQKAVASAFGVKAVIPGMITKIEFQNL